MWRRGTPKVPIEHGLVFSEPDHPGFHARSIVVAFNDGGWQGSAWTTFADLYVRCGDGSATRESLLREGVQVAPRALWSAIAATLLPEQPTDFYECTVLRAREPGRTLTATAEAPRLGDDWIADQLVTTGWLRYRWEQTEREPELDETLQRMLKGGDAALAAARTLEPPPPPQRRGWRKPPPPQLPRFREAAENVATICVALAADPFSQHHAAHEQECGWDAATELQAFARSMFGGPLYVSAEMPSTLDRILLRLDER